MYIVPIAWLYVTLLMAVTEASASNGTVLGAAITFLLYGVLPITLVVYVMGAPARKRAIKAREQLELAQNCAAIESTGGSVNPPDACGQTPADTVAPMRKKA